MINGFKKEMMFFMRGGRFAIIILVMIALAAMYPLMFGMMNAMIETMKGLYDEETFDQMFSMFSNFSAADITMYTVESVVEFGAIVMLFIFKSAAGGEQQKRSVIIPQCSGLSPVRYVFPKFAIYPIFMFLVSAISVYLGAGVSALLFPGGLDWGMVTVSACCSGVFLAFITSLQFCIGICTGRSGTSIAIVLVMEMFVPSILAFLRVDRFNPFALSSIATYAPLANAEPGNSMFASLGTASISNDVTPLNIAVSIGTAVVISVMLYFVTLFVLNTKQVHNEGDEPVL